MITASEFLRARLEERIAAAKAAAVWWGESTEPGQAQVWRAVEVGHVWNERDAPIADVESADIGAHIVAHDPHTVIEQCTAQLRVVSEFDVRDNDADLMLGRKHDPRRQQEWAGLRVAVQALAAAYATHPDYEKVHF